ncbi:hypothetical protein WT55_21185 [Burkholderia pseudomultivorans]|nr:hypothetical protein WT55_21185 [Burkholderia pseudomultivorans]
MNIPLLLTDNHATLIQNRHLHRDEPPSQIFEHHLLPGLRARLLHSAFEIHAPDHLISARRITEHHVIRLAARGVVLVRRPTVLAQLAGISSRCIGLIACCGLPLRIMGLRLIALSRLRVTSLRRGKSATDHIRRPGGWYGNRRRIATLGCMHRLYNLLRRCGGLDPVVQTALSRIGQTRKIGCFRLVTADFDAQQRSLQPNFAAESFVPGHANTAPRFRRHHVNHRLDHVRPIVFGDQVRSDILERELIRRILQKILIARPQVTLAHALRNLIKRRAGCFTAFLFRWGIAVRARSRLTSRIGIVADGLITQTRPRRVKLTSTSGRHGIQRSRVEATGIAINFRGFH